MNFTGGSSEQRLIFLRFYMNILLKCKKYHILKQLLLDLETAGPSVPLHVALLTAIRDL